MSMFVKLSREARAGFLPLYLHVPCGESVSRGERYDTVLQWGAAARDTEGAYVMNPVKCVMRAAHKKSVRNLLAVHGIRTEVELGGFIREYAVPVFHLDAISVFEKERSPAMLTGIVRPVRTARPTGEERRGGSVMARDERPYRQEEPGEALGGRYRELAPEERLGHYVRRAKREAVRSVYALGLATGLVRIGITPKGRTVVADVDPAPPLDIRLAELFADAIERYAAEEERDRWERGPLILGADPEFVLRRPDGRMVSASNYMEREGPVGCDAVVLAQHRVILPLAELRPKPRESPRELVRELRRTMLQASRMIGDGSLAWLAGSMPAKGLPLGGHIHFSGAGLNERMLRALDNYVALPVALVEGSAAGKRRPRYGSLGDFRRKRHGGFEYRPLPSWLATPELALAVLALARAVVLHYRELTQRPLDGAELQRAFYSGEKAELLPAVRGLWPDLERLPAYGEYRAELDAFRDRLFRSEGWDEQADIRIPWGIPPFLHKKVT